MPRGLLTLVMIILAACVLGAGAWWFGRSGGQTAAVGTAPFSTARTMPAGGWGAIHVMTANVRLDEPSDGENGWLKRRELLVKTLLKYQPDILGCQELSPAQGAYLNKELAQWYTYYPRGGVGAGGTPGGQTRSAAAQILGALSETLASLDTLYYRNDRFDIVDGEAGLVLPKEPQANATENTFFSLSVLREKRGQDRKAAGAPADTLIVVDVHFRHEEAFAIRCAKEMRKKIDGWLAKYPGSGIIMMGDINRGRGTQLYAAIMAADPAASALADTFDYSKLPTDTLNGTYQQFIGKPNSQTPTDLIFFGGSLQSSQTAEILRDHTPEGRYPSDHYFVQADVQWKP